MSSYSHLYSKIYRAPLGSLKSVAKRLYNWAVQWLVKFNPIKTESLLFSSRVNLQDHPTLFFNDVLIQEVVAHKHLGVYLTQRCDWQNILILSKKKLGLE